MVVAQAFSIQRRKPHKKSSTVVRLIFLSQWTKLITELFKLYSILLINLISLHCKEKVILTEFKPFSRLNTSEISANLIISVSLFNNLLYALLNSSSSDK